MDSGLLNRLRRHEEDAFAEVIDAHSPMMLSLARSVVGADGPYEELVQECWLSAFEAIGEFEGRSSLATWLGQIVLNRARTWLRASGRGAARASASDEIDELVDRDGHWLTPPAPWTLPPDAIVRRQEVQRAVEVALESLPEQQRQAVILRDLQGLSPEEVCHILGVTESNQRQLLHRGRLRLRKALEGFER